MVQALSRIVQSIFVQCTSKISRFAAAHHLIYLVAIVVASLTKKLDWHI
jgi:hypothetical protein